MAFASCQLLVVKVFSIKCSSSNVRCNDNEIVKLSRACEEKLLCFVVLGTEKYCAMLFPEESKC